MVVGIVIALFQALTQVQEVTLTFIPKIIVILRGHRAYRRRSSASQIFAFTNEVYGQIETGF